MKIYFKKNHEFDVSDIDDCKDNPCNNGGTCQDGIASYTCLCPLGFNGTDCEISIALDTLELTSINHLKSNFNQV